MRRSTHSQCFDVFTHRRSIYRGVTTNVQINEATPTEPLHEPSHEGRHVILSCVCPCPNLFHSIMLMVRIINSILVFSVLNTLGNAGSIPMYGWRIVLVGVLRYIPAFPLIPRFILNLRELYAHNLSLGGRGSAIDTAFGYSPGIGQDAAVSAIVFADAGPNGDHREEQAGEIQMERMEREIRSAGSGA